MGPFESHRNLLVATFVILALSFPAAVLAAVVETIPTPPIGVASPGVLIGIPGLPAGQSFTVSVTGEITSIATSVLAPSAGSDTLQVYSGAGFGGALLYSQPIMLAPNAVGVLQTITLTTPLPVIPGTYTFGIATTDVNLMHAETTAPYAGGVAFSVGAPTPFDLYFEVIVEDSTGTIILEKQTDPNDPNETFLFDVSSIDPNDPNTILGDGDTTTFADILEGTYRVSELLPAGWGLNNVSCAVDTGSNDSFDPNDPNDPTGYDIVLNGGQTVTCTYFNRQFRADLSVTKDASPLAVSASELVTYTITVTNNGPDDATDVMVTDPLAMGLGFLSATPSQGTCSEMGGTVTCDLGTIADQGVATVELVVETLAPGVYDNSVTVTTSGLDADGAAASAPAVVAAASDVPALDEWALLMLAMLLAMAGFVAMRR